MTWYFKTSQSRWETNRFFQVSTEHLENAVFSRDCMILNSLGRKRTFEYTRVLEY